MKIFHGKIHGIVLVKELINADNARVSVKSGYQLCLVIELFRAFLEYACLLRGGNGDCGIACCAVGNAVGIKFLNGYFAVGFAVIRKVGYSKAIFALVILDIMPFVTTISDVSNLL